MNPWHPIDHFDLRNGPFLKPRPRLEPLSLLSFRWDLSDYYFYKWYVLLNFAHEEIAYCYYLFCNAFLKVSKSRKIALSYRLAAHPSIILCETFATSGLNKALSKIICKTAFHQTQILKKLHFSSLVSLLPGQIEFCRPKQMSPWPPVEVANRYISCKEFEIHSQGTDGGRTPSFRWRSGENTSKDYSLAVEQLFHFPSKN